MSKKCKIMLIILAAVISFVIVGLLFCFFYGNGIFGVYFKLNGPQNLILEVHHGYQELGVKAKYRFQNLEEDVRIEGHIDTNQIGEYKLSYHLPQTKKHLQRNIQVKDTTPPNIQLKGDSFIKIFQNETFEDPGYESIDAYDGDLTQKVEVNMEQVKFEEPGIYKILYCVVDTSGNRAEATRQIEVLKDPTTTKLFYNYDSYSNKKEEWWFQKNMNHQQVEAAQTPAFLKKYDAYYMGDRKKTIYLTFDEGGNDTTYIKEIVNVLNKHDVKATFFLTRNYLTMEKEFMKELVANGHVIGNHSWHHYDMPTLANQKQIDQFVLEISETEKTYLEVIGQEMPKIFRFPKGSMSERACKIVQDLGYRNYFWSHAYYDFAEDVSKEKAYQSLVNHYHDGAIYLLHPSNKGNYLAMEDFILTMKEKGYHFDTVDKIGQ